MRHGSLTRKKALRRKSWFNWRPGPRYWAKRAERFGEQAELCRRTRCCVCGRLGSEPHHEPPGAGDESTSPLCSAHHRLGPLARHRMTRARFEQIHGVDLVAVAAGMALRLRRERERA